MKDGRVRVARGKKRIYCGSSIERVLPRGRNADSLFNAFYRLPGKYSIKASLHYCLSEGDTSLMLHYRLRRDFSYLFFGNDRNLFCRTRSTTTVLHLPLFTFLFLLDIVVFLFLFIIFHKSQILEIIPNLAMSKRCFLLFS